jgi:hypothetical protein
VEGMAIIRVKAMFETVLRNFNDGLNDVAI